MEVPNSKRTDLTDSESKITDSESREILVGETEINEPIEIQMTDKVRASHYLRVLEREQILCVDVEELLGDYAEDDLPQALKTRIDDHIGLCAECSQLKADYNMIIEVAEEMGREEPEMPLEVQNRLRQRLNASLGLKLPILDMPLSELLSKDKGTGSKDGGLNN